MIRGNLDVVNTTTTMEMKAATNLSLKLLLTSLLLFILVLIGANGFAATTTLLNSGAWELPGNWSTGSVPNSADDVIIPGNVTVTISSAAVCGSLSIGDGGLSSTLSITGTNSLLVTTSGGRNGNIYVNPNNNIELYQINVNAGSLTVEGQVISGGHNGGAISVSSGTISFTNTSATTWGEAVDVTISSTGNVVFNGDLSINTVTSGTTLFSITGGGTFTFNGVLNQDDANSTISNSGTAGNFYFNAGYIRNAGTLTTMNGENVYCAVEFTNNASALTLDANSNLIINANCQLNPNTAITFGNVRVNSGYSVRINGNISVAGNWTNNGGTNLPGASTVTFNGTTNKSINGTSASQDFNNIVVAMSAGQTLSVGGSTSTLNARNLTLSTGSFTAGAASTMNISENLSTASGTTYTAGTNTNLTGSLSNAGTYSSIAGQSLNFTGALAATVSGAGTYTVYNIALNKSAKTTPVEITSNSFITGINTAAVYNFTFTRGTWKYNTTATLNNCHNLGVTTALTIPFDVVIESNAGTMNLCASGNMASAVQSNTILSGKLWINGGIVNVLRSTTLVDFQFDVNGGAPELVVSSGTLNLGAGFNFNPFTADDYINFEMTGGTINTGTAVNTLSTFALGNVAGGSTLMSGGTIIIEEATSGNYPDLDLGGSNVSPYSVTGGTVQFGNGSTSAGTTFTFQAHPTRNYPHISISTTVNKTVRPFNNASFQMLSLNIPSGMTFDVRDDQTSSDTKTMTLTGAASGVALSRSGTLNMRTSTLEFAGTTNQAINSGSATLSLYHVIFNNSSQVNGGTGLTTLNVQDLTLTQGTFAPGLITTMTVNGNVTLTSGTFTTPTTLNARGNWTNNGATLDYGTGTVNFTGTGAQEINGTSSSESFYNLTVNKTAGTLLSTGGSINTLNILNNLTNTLGNFTAPATLNITGNYTLTNGTFTAGTLVAVGRDWSHSSTASAVFVPGSGTVNFNGSGTQNITGTRTSETFTNVTVNKTGGTLLRCTGSIATLNFTTYTQTTGNFTAGTAGTIACSGNFTVQAGTFTGGTNVTIHGQYNLDGGSYVGGSVTTFNGIANINNGVHTAGATTHFNNALTVNGGSYTAGATTNLNNTITLNGGTYTTGNSTNVRGDFTINTGATFTATAGTATFNGSSSQVINGTAGSITFFNFTVNKTAGLLVSTGGSLNTLTVNNFIETSGDFTAPTTLYVNGNITLTAGTFTPGSIIELRGGFSKASAHNYIAGTGLIRFTGTGTQTINGTSTSISFYNVEINKSVASTLNRGGSVVTITTNNILQTQGNFTAPPTLNINGDYSLVDGTFTASTTINIYGNWSHSNSGSAVFTPGVGTVHFLGGADQTIGGTAASETFYRIVINKTSGTSLTVAGSVSSLTTTNNFTQTQGNFNAPASTVIGGTLTMTDGTFNAGSLMTIAGSFTRSNAVTAVFNHNNGTVTFNGTGTQTLNGTATSATFYNLIVNKAAGTLNTGGSVATLNMENATVTSGTFTTPATTNIYGDLTLDGGVLNAGANTYLSGDFMNNGGTFVPGTNNYRLVSTTAVQHIGGTASTTFYNLILNNTGATTPQIEVGNAIQVNNTLTFTSGIIDLNSNVLTIGSSTAARGSITAPSAVSYVTGGGVRRWFAATTLADNNIAGLYPVGDHTGNGFSPLYLSMNVAPTTGGTVSVEYSDAATNTNVNFLDGPTPVEVRTDARWSISSGDGLANGTYRINAGRSFCPICVGSINDLRLVLANSTTGTAGTNSGSTTFPYVQRIGVTLANLTNNFYVGSISGINTPLPVELGDFTGNVENKQTKLRFFTYTETNNDFFTIERSKDGSVWETVTTVEGAGTTNSITQYSATDVQPYSGVSFYRLSQTDFNGDSKQLKTISLNVDAVVGALPVIYPNPGDGTAINIDYTSANNGKVIIEVINVSGQMVYSREINVEAGLQNHLELRPRTSMPSGKYFVRIIDGEKNYTDQLIIR